ncbi:MAG: outer membrane protein assembly factor BamE [Verrucomicrobia bacterium]|nr:outer membrane protein assembly factor BamE [Verrucomicrobiota bacterium]MBI3869006.1 outer membrane protein assembly factor BamE [Verrucomicrobiota bacterium]
MKKIICVTAAVLTLCGCASVGRKIDQSKVDQIKQGVTTREEVRKLIGSPDQLIKTSDGVEMWIYSYFLVTTKGSTFIPIIGAFAGGANTTSQSLSISFGADGIVSRYTSAIGGSNVGTGLGVAGPDKGAVRTIDEGKRPR